MQRHGISATEPALVLADPRVAQVCADLADMAEARFTEARRAMAMCKPGTMRPAAVMAGVYRASLDRLRRRGWTRLAEPAPVPKLTKIWLALRYGLL